MPWRPGELIFKKDRKGHCIVFVILIITPISCFVLTYLLKKNYGNNCKYCIQHFASSSIYPLFTSQYLQGLEWFLCAAYFKTKWRCIIIYGVLRRNAFCVIVITAWKRGERTNEIIRYGSSTAGFCRFVCKRVWLSQKKRAFVVPTF